MKLALYHPWIYLRGGVERMLCEVGARSQHQWTIFTHHYEPDSTFPELGKLDVVELRPTVSVERSLGPLARAAAVIATSRLPIRGFDALLVSSESIGDFITLRNRLPTICYCHTPLKILFDPLTNKRLMGRDWAKGKTLAVMGPPFRVSQRRAWRRYDHILVNSHEVRGRIVRAGLARESQIEVLHPGVDSDRFRAPTMTGRSDRPPRLLVAGRIMWQKHIELAIDAFATISVDFPDAELVIAGGLDQKSRPYIEELRRRSGELPVRFEANPTDARLIELLGTSRALVSTPLNEDFGIVNVEAMACGTPVIAVNQGGPRESVISGETGWLLPPDAAAFAQQMAVVLRGSFDQDAFSVAARRRAGEFSWDAFVGRVDDVMERTVAGHLGPGPTHAG